jgi:hypothetical protein
MISHRLDLTYGLTDQRIVIGIRENNQVIALELEIYRVSKQTQSHVLAVRKGTRTLKCVTRGDMRRQRRVYWRCWAGSGGGICVGYLEVLM